MAIVMSVPWWNVVMRSAATHGVFQHADAIVLGALVVLGPKMRVAFDDQEPALQIERHADGMNDVRRGGEEDDLDLGIVGARWIRLTRMG